MADLTTDERTLLALLPTDGSTDGRIKGILVSAYGPDASALTQEMVRKLATHGRG